MKRKKQILLGAGCFLLLLLSWLATIGAKSDTAKQADLIAQATTYISDGIYIRAVPLLEEAVSYDGRHTLEAETELKTVYLNLIDQSGYARKYTGLLEKQMAQKNAAVETFAEAAHYYLDISKFAEAMAALKDGIQKTESEELVALYEKERYAYEVNRVLYDDVTAIFGATIQVKTKGRWGLAQADGTPLVPCVYDKISTFSNHEAIVKKGKEISAIDGENNRVALLHGEASNFGNFSENRVALQTEDGWKRADGELQVGTAVFQSIGMYSDGYAAAMQNGKWGVVDKENKWLIPAEYDAVVQDELGRCMAQEAVFVRANHEVLLFVDGERVGESYEDAKPFASGYAAVKKAGKWGFIDTAGTAQIDFQFEDALSFGQHLAAVKQGEKWGYINLFGDVVIAPTFQRAKSFSNGSAPVFVEGGWQFITLLEYLKGAGL